MLVADEGGLCKEGKPTVDRVGVGVSRAEPSHIECPVFGGRPGIHGDGGAIGFRAACVRFQLRRARVERHNRDCRTRRTPRGKRVTRSDRAGRTIPERIMSVAGTLRVNVFPDVGLRVGGRLHLVHLAFVLLIDDDQSGTGRVNCGCGDRRPVRRGRDRCCDTRRRAGNRRGEVRGPEVVETSVLRGTVPIHYAQADIKCPLPARVGDVESLCPDSI